LRQWLARAGIAGVRERVLTEVVRQARGAPDRSPDVVVADGVSVRRYRNQLHLVRQARPPFETVAWVLGHGLELPNGTLTSIPAAAAGLREHRGGDGSTAAAAIVCRWARITTVKRLCSRHRRRQRVASVALCRRSSPLCPEPQ
jgi:hypothetical protein